MAAWVDRAVEWRRLAGLTAVVEVREMCEQLAEHSLRRARDNGYTDRRA
jgi:hypothetical protein